MRGIGVRSDSVRLIRPVIRKGLREGRGRGSLYHEARAAGMIYQATLRWQVHQSMGFEWAPVDESTGMADRAPALLTCDAVTCDDGLG